MPPPLAGALDDTLAVAVIDPAGGPLVVTDLANTEAGSGELEALPAEHHDDRNGIEWSGNDGRGAAVRLVLAGGVDAVEVPPIVDLPRALEPARAGQDTEGTIAVPDRLLTLIAGHVERELNAGGPER